MHGGAQVVHTATRLLTWANAGYPRFPQDLLTTEPQLVVTDQPKNRSCHVLIKRKDRSSRPGHAVRCRTREAAPAGVLALSWAGPMLALWLTR